jgi:hypothetical protein
MRQPDAPRRSQRRAIEFGSCRKKLCTAGSVFVSTGIESKPNQPS